MDARAGRALEPRRDGTSGGAERVAPGGNSVDAFLDLVAPDGTGTTALGKTLDELRPLAVQKRRAHLRSGNVCAELSINLGTPDAGAVFDELARAALSLYERPPARPWLELPPLRIDATSDAEERHFVLDDESAARVREAGGQPARAHVRRDVADEFRRMYGELYPWVAQWVTNLTRERLLELGGTRIVEGGKVVDEWPKRSK